MNLSLMFLNIFFGAGFEATSRTMEHTLRIVNSLHHLIWQSESTGKKTLVIWNCRFRYICIYIRRTTGSRVLTKMCFGTAHEFTNVFLQCGQMFDISRLSRDAGLSEREPDSGCPANEFISPDILCCVDTFDGVIELCFDWDDDAWLVWEEKCFVISGVSGNGPNEGRSLSILFWLVLFSLLRFIVSNHNFVLNLTSKNSWTASKTFFYNSCLIFNITFFLQQLYSDFSISWPFRVKRNMIRSITKEGGTWPRNL